MRRKLGMSLAVLICLAGYAEVQAAPITYTFSGIGSGSLGATPFFDAPFTITSMADTTQVTQLILGVFIVPDISATVSVSGVGNATFTVATITVCNQNVRRAGVSDPAQNRAILFVGNDLLVSYDLTTSIGPLSGPNLINENLPFSTTAGSFALSAVSNASFQATLVPEPSSLLLVGLCMAAIPARRRTTSGRCHPSPA